MPIYDYKCVGCEHSFEQSQLIKNRLKPEKKPCPKCGEKKVHQYLPTAPGIHSGINMKKPDGGFREVLSKIAQAHPKHKFGHHL